MVWVFEDYVFFVIVITITVLYSRGRFLNHSAELLETEDEPLRLGLQPLDAEEEDQPESRMQ